MAQNKLNRRRRHIITAQFTLKRSSHREKMFALVRRYIVLGHHFRSPDRKSRWTAPALWAARLSKAVAVLECKFSLWVASGTQYSAPGGPCLFLNYSGGPSGSLGWDSTDYLPS